MPAIERKRAGSLSRVLPVAVQHVAETSVEPRLAGCIVALGIDRRIVDVRKVAAQASKGLSGNKYMK